LTFLAEITRAEGAGVLVSEGILNFGGAVYFVGRCDVASGAEVELETLNVIKMKALAIEKSH
jgi:hypothetical protein